MRSWMREHAQHCPALHRRVQAARHSRDAPIPVSASCVSEVRRHGRREGRRSDACQVVPRTVTGNTLSSDSSKSCHPGSPRRPRTWTSRLEWWRATGNRMAHPHRPTFRRRTPQRSGCLPDPNTPRAHPRRRALLRSPRTSQHRTRRWFARRRWAVGAVGIRWAMYWFGHSHRVQDNQRRATEAFGLEVYQAAKKRPDGDRHRPYGTDLAEHDARRRQEARRRCWCRCRGRRGCRRRMCQGPTGGHRVPRLISATAPGDNSVRRLGGPSDRGFRRVRGRPEADSGFRGRVPTMRSHA
jgi:hypothetical protein